MNDLLALAVSVHGGLECLTTICSIDVATTARLISHAYH
jgi:hypothetical protein